MALGEEKLAARRRRHVLRTSVLVALPAVEKKKRRTGREGKMSLPSCSFVYCGLSVLSPFVSLLFLWCQVFSSLEIRIAMPHESNLFSAVNRDFRILMKATEKNPNVLQACSRISKFTVIY